MKFDPEKCPVDKCGELAEGTVDRLYGKAVLTHHDDGTFEYSGFTEVWWGSQVVEKDDKGRWEMVCYNGHEWHATMTETEKKPA